MKRSKFSQEQIAYALQEVEGVPGVQPRTPSPSIGRTIRSKPVVTARLVTNTRYLPLADRPY